MARTARRTTTRRLALLAALPLALGSLAGCSDGGSGDSGDSEAAVASPSASASAGDDETTGVEDAALEGEQISADDFMAIYTAAFEQATTAAMTISTTSDSLTMEGEGVADFTSTPPDMELSMTSATLGGSMDLRLVDGVMYLLAPMSKGNYLAVDLDDPANPLGSMLSDQLDPRATFDVFEQAITAATYVGSEDVDGESLERYQVQLDAATMLAALDAPAAGAGSVPESLTYDMWFDADGRYRRLQVDLGELAGELAVTYADWGTDVSIEAPPADRIKQMPGSTTQS